MTRSSGHGRSTSKRDMLTQPDLWGDNNLGTSPPVVAATPRRAPPGTKRPVKGLTEGDAKRVPPHIPPIEKGPPLTVQLPPQNRVPSFTSASIGSDTGHLFTATLRSDPYDPPLDPRARAGQTYEVALLGPHAFTPTQTEALTLTLANLGNARFHRTQATQHLNKIPYFPRALWSAASLTQTLYDLLQPLIDGVMVTARGGRPYTPRTLDQPSDEAQGQPQRYWLDVDSQSGPFTPEPSP